MSNEQDVKSGKRVRVLIVDDSATVRAVVTSILSADEDIEVVGWAKNGEEAIELVPMLKPDIVTMDILMPKMNGFEAIEHIMAHNPVPITVLTSSLTRKDKNFVYDALGMGALTVIEKPRNLPELKCDLAKKVKLLARVPVITHMRGRSGAKVEAREIPAAKRGTDKQVVGIVSSTGGPSALQEILSKMPADFPACIVIVQHLAEGFDEDLIGWLNDKSGVPVARIIHREAIRPGIAFIAPPGKHTIVNKQNRFELIDSPPVWGFRPSGDVLLSSISAVYGPRAIGVILTGMGRDGAQGMKALREAGGTTIAQNEETSLIYGMPGAAVEIGAIDTVSPLGSITDEIIRGL